METARELLKQGKILAIKGVGGYHLACDATNDDAVGLLRDRKKREAKPFALMCRDLEAVRAYCEVSTGEEHLLTSPARPIILLKRTSLDGLTDAIAPGLDTLGVMLPYTPLHYGLFDNDLSVLVMTSANISGDPLILTEEDAYRELGDLADIFVVHKREIVNRGDDSVIMLFNGGPYFIRRARGYVPQGIRLPCTIAPVFAAGGDLKSVFAYGREKKAVLSQYFGDLDTLNNVEAYLDGVRFFEDFLKITPEKVVCDLHPDYVGAGYAGRYAGRLDVPLVRVQHHKAHFTSAMVDAGLDEKVLGVVCDGTGYGDDGSIWGCEVFHGDYESIDRVASLEPFIQPRGDGVAKYPLHMAAVLLYSLWKDEKKLLQILPESADLLPFVQAQVANKNLGIPSSSGGRLFDAAAALCGFTSKSTYEGEAPMCMEALARSSGIIRDVKPYQFTLHEDGMVRLSWHFLDEMAEDKRRGTDPGVLAARFHRTFTTTISAIIEKLAASCGTRKVVFSGGTFQNRLIIAILAEELPAKGIEPYFHRQVPTNDGGLALGQIILAGTSLVTF
ncbi:MAG: carbamoyltransferase HypF, partial [Candidatus Aquicultor sp.]